MTHSAQDEDEAYINASKAPLMDHLIELRSRLIKVLIAFLAVFIIAFFFAKNIFNILTIPWVLAAGPDGNSELIYTAPQEYFFTQIKVGIFTAGFFTCPWIFYQIYRFVAPGLYRHERHAFAPYLVATPVFFALGGLLVYFMVMPNLLHFFMSMQQAADPSAHVAQITLLPKVSEYLSLIMTLIFAFGIVFQLPVVLTLLGNVGIIDSAFLKKQRRYALVLVCVVAAILTPPDVFSMLALVVPGYLLYELSIISVGMIEKKRVQGSSAGST